MNIKMQTKSQSGYHVIVWSYAFDPSLATLITSFPELVLGQRVAVASCDGGPFQPDRTDMAKGWTVQGTLAISPRVQSISDLPTPGFDEWYVYDEDACIEHHASFVNQYDFRRLVNTGNSLKIFGNRLNDSNLCMYWEQEHQ